MTEGVRGALQTLGHLASFYDTERVDVAGDDALDEGYDAPCGLCIGPPTAASVMEGRGDHRHRLLMVATNSSWLPAFTMEQASLLVTAFVGTSPWASEIIRKYVPSEMPVLTYPHGVDDGFHPLAGAEKYERFSVLHMASTHAERKGTRELIFGWCEAWREQSIPTDSMLRLIIDGSRGTFLDTIHDASHGIIACAESIVVMPRLDLSVADTAKLYSMHHFVAQPSRSEGFGLVPLEARACGVPVIATACTGHAVHLGSGTGSDLASGVVVVPHGDDERVDDGPGAMAPWVRPAAVVAALGIAFERRSALAEAAMLASARVRQEHSWTAVTRRFVAEYGTALGLA